MTLRNVFLGIVAILIVGLALYLLYFQMNPNASGSIQAPQEVSSETGTSPSQAKININEVCEGALAYMSFTDGASAEAFVAECKEGKHPEVIEQFKAQLNINGGAAI